MQRAVVKGHAFRGQIVGAHDGRVAARPAAAQVALVHYGHVGYAVFGGQVVGSCEAVEAAADDDYVIGVFEFGLAPHAGPGAAG